MTPEKIVEAADAVLSAPPPRGWLDCGLAIDLVARRAGLRPPLGEMVKAYDTPVQAVRHIRKLGGWPRAFERVVKANGYRSCDPCTGAMGYVENRDLFFGVTCAICVQPGAWVVPLTGGYAIMTEARGSCRA